jgi:GNAT superfamily N-acetyltransferase
MMQPNFSARYTFIRGRQLEGTYPGNSKTGIWPITALRIGRGWGYVPHEERPHDDSVWPPVEPPGLDRLAIGKPDFYYQRVRTLGECKSVLAFLKSPVMVSLNISDAWYNAPNGRIPEISPSDVPVGAHTVVFHGYDDMTREFSFQNSWGAAWGDQGHGYIPYTVFEETWVEGWFTELAAKPLDDNPRAGVAERRWGVSEHGGGILHCYEFVDSKAGKIGWTFFIERNGMIEVEELFIMPAFRRSGYAAKLVTLIRDYAHERSASIREWISHADTAPENIEVIQKFASILGLALSASPERWASYVVGNTERATEFGASGTSTPRAVRPSAPQISSVGKVHPLCSPIGF